MLEKLNEIQQTGLTALTAIYDEEALQKWHTTHLGRNSALMEVFKSMGSVPAEERGNIGRAANQVKHTLEAAYTEKVEALKQAALEHSLSQERPQSLSFIGGHSTRGPYPLARGQNGR